MIRGELKANYNINKIINKICTYKNNHLPNKNFTCPISSKKSDLTTTTCAQYWAPPWTQQVSTCQTHSMRPSPQEPSTMGEKPLRNPTLTRAVMTSMSELFRIMNRMCLAYLLVVKSSTQHLTSTKCFNNLMRSSVSTPKRHNSHQLHPNTRKNIGLSSTIHKHQQTCQILSVTSLGRTHKFWPIKVQSLKKPKRGRAFSTSGPRTGVAPQSRERRGLWA